jgi:osmotically-inducible protein OsmY
MKSDTDIEKDVEAELEWNRDIHSPDITVAVKNRVVMLSGFVRSYTEKFEAERAVKRVAGVVGVANDIEVRLPGSDLRPDPEIARDVLREIKSELPSAWESIKPIVERGRVTLEGEVEWHYQRERAERAVRRVKGVKQLSNLIKLKPSVTPSEVKRGIEEAFRRSATLDASRITVEATGSEVVLKGTVRSWPEREEAERAAWAAPGVTKVDNQIAVSA